jgi:hypothetical protein
MATRGSVHERLRTALLDRFTGEQHAALDIGLRFTAATRNGERIDSKLAVEHAVAETEVLGPLRASLGLDEADPSVGSAAPVPEPVLDFFHALGMPTSEQPIAAALARLDQPADPPTGFDRVEHLRRGVEERWNRGNLVGFMAGFSPDAVLVPDAAHTDEVPPVAGRDEIATFFRRVHRPVTWTALTAVGDSEVFASFRWIGSPSDDADRSLLYRYDGRQIVHARFFADPAHARAAAGLA